MATLTGSPAVVRVTQGETVQIRVQTDEPAEIHLHGYSVAVVAEPGTPGTLRYEAPTRRSATG